ncbi:MAG: hypothetical protein JJE04_03295 [Acidobacteriia bacterium]|nr:hypothetical protein [Terriglobia bacterium]
MASYLFAFLLAASLQAAGSPSLGVASSPGGFKLNNAAVTGSATLFDGSIIETVDSPSRLGLASGASFQLSPNSRARLHHSRLVLERGFADVLPGKASTIEARSLLITPASSDSRGRIALRGANLVRVAAASGAFRVYNASGVLISRLEPGDALEFEPQDQGPAPPSSAFGCVLKKDNKFVIFDQSTRLTVELQGAGIEKEWGNRVQANGTARSTGQPGTATTQVLFVTSLTRLETGGCSEVASALNAQLPNQPAPSTANPATPTSVSTAPPATKSTGMSAGTKVAIVAAVAGGGGAAAYLATQGKDRSK